MARSGCQSLGSTDRLFRLQGRRMPIIVNRGGPENEHVDLSSSVGGPDWEAVRTFLELARCGSIRSAADRMGLSPNALRRKIDELERTLGTVLITRHVDGIRPTPEGAEILAAAKRMEEAAFGLVRARNRAVPAMSGEVRIGITEAFGTFWLGPRLVEFQRAYPQLGVDLMCAMRSADVLRMLAYAVLENVGYRQLNDAWRMLALVDLARRKQGWGAQTRRGIGRSLPRPAPSAGAVRRGLVQR